MRCKSIPINHISLDQHTNGPKTNPIGNLARHGSNHDNAAWDVLLLEDAGAVLRGNKCSDHAG